MFWDNSESNFDHTETKIATCGVPGFVAGANKIQTLSEKNLIQVQSLVYLVFCVLE